MNLRKYKPDGPNEEREGIVEQVINNGTNFIIRVTEEATDVVDELKSVYETLSEPTAEGTFLIPMADLKHATTEQKIEAIRYGLNTPTLNDPLMQLNLYNLVKSYNNMNDDFFNSDDIYFNSVEELLDVKLALGAEIKAFIRQLSIYFVSLLKSYNKMMFTPAEEHIELPQLYKNMVLSSDIMTLSGILAKSPAFSTDELVYINNAYVYMTTLIDRSKYGLGLLNNFIDTLEQTEVSE